MTNSKVAALLVGRTIKDVRLNAFRDENAGGSRWTANPVLVLDDGSELRLFVHETETGEYGIDLDLKKS